jgi:hypothetical protein
MGTQDDTQKEEEKYSGSSRAPEMHMMRCLGALPQYRAAESCRGLLKTHVWDKNSNICRARRTIWLLSFFLLSVDGRQWDLGNLIFSPLLLLLILHSQRRRNYHSKSHISPYTTLGDSLNHYTKVMQRCRFPYASF